MNIREAFYIKLGAGGKWAAEAIATAKIRFGWENIPLALVHAGDWPGIRKLLKREHSNKSTVTKDTERLRDLAASTSEDVWITFHNSRLYWGRLDDGPMQEDHESKFRCLRDGWFDEDAKGRLLLANQIPGRIAQLQGFRGTVCRVAERAALARLIAGETSPEFDQLYAARAALISAAANAIRQLHWKDFETLTDLLFREAGWRRRTVIGRAMKFADLELEAPITGSAYQVQVKSRAALKDFHAYVHQFDGRGFERLFFVVHTPSKDLADAEVPDYVDLVLPERLGGLVVDHGLSGWLLDKVR